MKKIPIPHDYAARDLHGGAVSAPYPLGVVVRGLLGMQDYACKLHFYAPSRGTVKEAERNPRCGDDAETGGPRGRTYLSYFYS